MSYRLLPIACLVVCLAAPLAATTVDLDAPQVTPDPGWPREYTGEDFRLVLYQPQINYWQDYQKIEAYLAVMLTPPGSEETVAGAVKVRAKTDTHMDTRTVFIHDIEIAEVRFPSLAGTSTEDVEKMVRSTFPEEPVALSLDRLLASIESSQTRGRKVELNDAPPPIFVSTRPAILINVDGEPAWVPAGESGLHYVANTNWDLFRLSPEKKKAKQKKYYLRNYGAWLAADDLEGPWSAAGKLPKAFKKLPKGANFQDVNASLPGEKLTPGQVPEVYLSQKPAELIAIEGEPKLVAIPDTPILLVDNTESDLFRHIDDGRYYFLVAGRWFRAAQLEGPWESAMGELPQGFEAIPEEHEKAHVLASVPGTPQAEEAVIEAQIPTVAMVSRADAPKEVRVQYSGDPEFRDIEGAPGLAYAVNTSSDVIRFQDTYYLCQEGVWLSSNTPHGAWTVADQIPKEIYDIPSSSPVHHTTYVYVYDSTPDTVVYGYTGGYMGLYYGWGCTVWGTGWYYPPYYHWSPYYGYPIYYPYPYTYGAGAWYNPTTGFYGRGHYYYGPYGGAGAGHAYNPRTGTYARGGYAYSYGGATAWGQAYNPRTGTRAAGYRSSNAYSAWGRGVVARGDQWLQSGYYADERGSVRGFKGSGGTTGGAINRGDHRTGIVRGDNNTYVGRDGNVYRRDDTGWSKYGDGGWNPIERDRPQNLPSGGLTDQQKQQARDRAGSIDRGSVTRDLDRSAADRARGNNRAGQYDNWRSSGGWSNSARGRSYGGGGARGGGARARGGGGRGRIR